MYEFYRHKAHDGTTDDVEDNKDYYIHLTIMEGCWICLDPEGLKVASIEAEHEENGPDVYCQKTFALWWESPDASLIKLLVDLEQKNLLNRLKMH